MRSPDHFRIYNFIGYGIGPLIGYLLSSQSGSEIVLTALSGETYIFWLIRVGSSVPKDFSFLRGFIAAGCLVLIAAIVINLIWPMPALQLAMSVGFMFFSVRSYFYQTSEDNSWWRKKLHISNNHAVCFSLQYFHEPATPAYGFFRR